jgi:hypothetical protein
MVEAMATLARNFGTFVQPHLVELEARFPRLRASFWSIDGPAVGAGGEAEVVATLQVGSPMLRNRQFAEAIMSALFGGIQDGLPSFLQEAAALAPIMLQPIMGEPQPISR